MKNQRLVKALEEMKEARMLAWSASSASWSACWSASSASWSACWSAVELARVSADCSAVDSASWSVRTNKEEVLEILKEKFNETDTIDYAVRGFTMREKLLKFYMDNPCLSEEIDYCDNDVRLEYYKKQIKEMTDVEVIEALEFDDDCQ